MDQEQPDYLKEQRENQIRQLMNWHKEFSDLWTVRSATVQFPPEVAQFHYELFLQLAAGMVPFLPPTAEDPQS